MTLELLKEIISKHFETKTFSQQNLSKLGNAEVYLVIIENSKYIVRITSMPYSIQNNYYSLNKLKNTNIAPKPIAVGTIKDYNYSIETFLLGEIKSKLSLTELNCVIKKISKLHSIKNKKCGYLNSLTNDWQSYTKSELILKHSKKFKELCPNATQYINYVLNNVPSSSDFSFLHGDLNEGNILNVKNDCFLFDFEGAFYGEKEYDLSYLDFRLNFSEEIINKFTKEYGYDKYKFYYYELCIMIRKIALSHKNKLKERIKKIERIYEKLQTF